jgi:hypothetical protein
MDAGCFPADWLLGNCAPKGTVAYKLPALSQLGRFTYVKDNCADVGGRELPVGQLPPGELV